MFELIRHAPCINYTKKVWFTPELGHDHFVNKTIKQIVYQWIESGYMNDNICLIRTFRRKWLLNCKFILYQHMFGGFWEYETKSQFVCYYIYQCVLLLPIFCDNTIMITQILRLSVPKPVLFEMWKLYCNAFAFLQFMAQNDNHTLWSIVNEKLPGT